jgi:hypothetical protein
MKLISDILTTEQREGNDCWGERRLWAEVIQQAYYRASIGEGTAINFFKSPMFHQLCSLLKLPEQLIQERVTSKAKLNQQRNNNTGDNHDR